MPLTPVRASMAAQIRWQAMRNTTTRNSFGRPLRLARWGRAREHAIAAVFLQGIIGLVGVGALVFLLVEPHWEGRNADATVWQVYFADPFLAYAYVASLAFFRALFHAFRVLHQVRQDQVFTARTVQDLRTLKRCALAMIGFALGGEAFLLLGAFGASDDRAGGTAMGLFIILCALVMAATASVCERIFRDAMTTKSPAA